MKNIDRIVHNAPADVLRELRSTRQTVQIMMSQFVGGVGQDALLGFAAHIEDARGQQRMVHLAITRWVREMGGWGANEWGWLVALILAQASDVLPPFSGETGRAGLALLPSYKMSPGRWEALSAALPAAFREILLDDRFRAESCCLRDLLPDSVKWTSMEYDARGDPALVFDTGFLWKRAQELLCAERPLEDRSARPAVRYVLNEGGEAVLDGKGVWHADLRAYIHARLQVLPPHARLSHALSPRAPRPAAHRACSPER